MSKKNIFRPKARIIHTVGKELIANPNVAILELVKNAYDADATEVKITNREENNTRYITIEDNGHGMTRDDIESKWLILATDNKKRNSKSPKGRVLLGNKGIGRYASALLGNQLEIKSYTKNESVALSLDWNDFTADKYLDEINILIESSANEDNHANGSSISIIGHQEELFNDIDDDKLERELSVLISGKEDFSVKYIKNGETKDILSFQDQYPDIIEQLYHYRMKGSITRDNQLRAVFTIKQGNIIIEEKKYTTEDFIAAQDLSDTGNITFDIKAYDGDREGKADLAKIAQDVKIDDILGKYGISIYRNNACLQPYGTKDYDWLLLDKARVQSTMKLGHNQVFGIITIEDEDKSSLMENSSREGLRQNKAYEDFVKKLQLIIQYMGKERAEYRRQTPSQVKTEFDKVVPEFHKILELKKAVLTPDTQIALDEKNIPKEEQEQFTEKVQEPIREISEKAIGLYEAKIHNLELYAILGKLVSVVSHELSTPIQNIKSVTKTIKESPECLSIEIRDSIVRKQNIAIKYLSNLKEMIKPLSVSKHKQEMINIKSTLSNILSTYKNSEEYQDIQFNTEGLLSDTLTKCFEADLYAIFHNLIDNTNFWCKKIEVNPKIDISSENTEDSIKIHFIDNGPGIAPKILGTLFEPGTTMKAGGSGLGLSVITSLLQRVKGSITLIPSEEGAHFCITLRKEF